MPLGHKNIPISWLLYIVCSHRCLLHVLITTLCLLIFTSESICVAEIMGHFAGLLTWQFAVIITQSGCTIHTTHRWNDTTTISFQNHTMDCRNANTSCCLTHTISFRNINTSCCQTSTTDCRNINKSCCQTSTTDCRNINKSSCQTTQLLWEY